MKPARYSCVGRVRVFAYQRRNRAIISVGLGKYHGGRFCGLQLISISGIGKKTD
jgi:hypothetical protein